MAPSLPSPKLAYRGKQNRGRSALDDGGVLPAAPFGSGPVVDATRRLAERIDRKRQDRSGDAGAATRHRRLVEIDTGLSEGGRDLVVRLETAVFQHLAKRHVEGAGHVAAAQASARLRRITAEAVGRPRIDNLRGFVEQHLLHIID